MVIDRQQLEHFLEETENSLKRLHKFEEDMSKSFSSETRQRVHRSYRQVSEHNMTAIKNEFR